MNAGFVCEQLELPGKQQEPFLDHSSWVAGGPPQGCQAGLLMIIIRANIELCVLGMVPKGLYAEF